MSEQIKKKSGFRWFVLALIFCIYMIAGADRSNIGMVVPYIQESFHMSNTDIGAMASFFYITYAVVQIPSGHLYGKRGVRKLYSLSIVLTSLATFIMGFANSALHLKFARALLGFSEGPINIGSLTTINRWFPAREKGIATGVFMASIKFAPAFVPPVCAWIIMMYGWREVFYIFAVPGTLFAILWWLFVKDNPKDSRFVNQAELEYINDPTVAVGKEVKKTDTGAVRYDKAIDKFIRTRIVKPLATNAEVLRSWNVWACALGYFFLVGITYTIMTWIPTYLVHVKHFSIIKVGLVAAAPWVGAVVGNLLGGIVSDKVFEHAHYGYQPGRPHVLPAVRAQRPDGIGIDSPHGRHLPEFRLLHVPGLSHGHYDEGKMPLCRVYRQYGRFPGRCFCALCCWRHSRHLQLGRRIRLPGGDFPDYFYPRYDDDRARVRTGNGSSEPIGGTLR